MAKKSGATKARDDALCAKNESAMKRPFSPGAARDWLWGSILVAAVVLTYLPVWHAGYFWDDFGYIVNAPNLVGFHGLKGDLDDQCSRYPVRFTFHHLLGGARLLWGVVPLPYHLVNVALHGACAVALVAGLAGPAYHGAGRMAGRGRCGRFHPVMVGIGGVG